MSINIVLNMAYSKCRKPKIKKKSWKNPEGRKHPTYRGATVKNDTGFPFRNQANKKRRVKSEIFKVLRETTNIEFYIQPIILPKRRIFSDKNQGDLLPVDWLARNVRRRASEKRKIIQVRNSDWHKERKSTREEINEGQIKYFIFCS